MFLIDVNLKNNLPSSEEFLECLPKLMTYSNVNIMNFNFFVQNTYHTVHIRSVNIR